jgi:asparagine synthase (glutamine-hydrolysing)
MCGIAAVVGEGAADAEPRLAGALEALRHRGPDAGGTASGAGWLLGFRRLAILDLSPTGNQPMVTPEGDAAMVFNGEIYNYRELRDELTARGEAVRSSGDAEVLLRWLRAHGSAGLRRLNGMFALVFLDLRRRRFLAVRDRLGVKPLYWTVAGAGLAFASELEPLLALTGRRPTLDAVDRIALNRYLAFGQIAPPHTIWSGIQKLPPGHYLEGSLSDAVRARPAGWWRLEGGEEPGRSAAAWLDELDALLADATRLRLASDVPVGVFLSGGIDSGLVASYSAAEQRAPFALTVDFDERQHSEVELASRSAAALGLKHHVLHVRAAAVDELPEIAWHCGEPFADSSILNQYQLARAARQLGIVFLSGDGGDEAFAGYDEYVRMQRWGSALGLAAAFGEGAAEVGARVLRPDSLLQRRLVKLSAGRRGFGALVRNNFRDGLWRHALRPELCLSRKEVEGQAWEVWERSRGLPLVKRMQRFDYEQYLEPDVLVKVDRATMACSIEARSPMLDYRVVELAARIPAEQSIVGGRGKQLLRALARRRLPAEVTEAPKRGFGLPVDDWSRPGTPFFARLRRTLTDGAARRHGLLDPSGVEALLGWHEAKPAHGLGAQLWRYLMLELWARACIDGDRSSAWGAE